MSDASATIEAVELDTTILNPNLPSIALNVANLPYRVSVREGSATFNHHKVSFVRSTGQCRVFDLEDSRTGLEPQVIVTYQKNPEIIVYGLPDWFLPCISRKKTFEPIPTNFTPVP